MAELDSWHVPSLHPAGDGAALARSATHREHLHAHRCSTRPSGFQTPRTHVLPQSQSVGVGAGAGGASTSIDALAAATAAAALGTSRSAAAGSAESQISHDTIHCQSVTGPSRGR